MKKLIRTDKEYEYRLRRSKIAKVAANARKETLLKRDIDIYEKLRKKLQGKVPPCPLHGEGCYCTP